MQERRALAVLAVTSARSTAPSGSSNAGRSRSSSRACIPLNHELEAAQGRRAEEIRNILRVADAQHPQHLPQIEATNAG